MCHIPILRAAGNPKDQLILRRIKGVMHSYGKFDRAETRAGVSADARAGFQHKLPNLVGDFLQIF
jgi:hypothetical protein